MPKYGLEFDLVESNRQIAQLGDFLRSNVGLYDHTRHFEWVETTCLPAITTDKRRALAWWEHGQMVGDAVLKPLDVGLVELKNFRVANHAEQRGLGGLMMKHAFLETQDLLAEKGLLDERGENITLQLDTTEGGVAQAFFEHVGFDVVETSDLYTPGKAEVIMQRQISLH